jgi:hypothetical protein
MQTTMAARGGSARVIHAAPAGNALSAATKSAAGTCPGSSAMLSEAIHSLVDTGNQDLLIRNARPPSGGHGSEGLLLVLPLVIHVEVAGCLAGPRGFRRQARLPPN